MVLVALALLYTATALNITYKVYTGNAASTEQVVNAAIASAGNAFPLAPPIVQITVNRLPRRPIDTFRPYGTL